MDSLLYTSMPGQTPWSNPLQTQSSTEGAESTDGQESPKTRISLRIFDTEDITIVPTLTHPASTQNISTTPENPDAAALTNDVTASSVPYQDSSESLGIETTAIDRVQFDSTNDLHPTTPSLQLSSDSVRTSDILIPNDSVSSLYNNTGNSTDMYNTVTFNDTENSTDMYNSLTFDNTVNSNNTYNTLTLNNTMNSTDMYNILSFNSTVNSSDTYDALTVNNTGNSTNMFNSLAFNNTGNSTDMFNTLPFNSTVNSTDTYNTLTVNNTVNSSDILNTLPSTSTVNSTDMFNSLAFNNTRNSTDIFNSLAFNNTVNSTHMYNTLTVNNTVNSTDMFNSLTFDSSVPWLTNSTTGFPTSIPTLNSSHWDNTKSWTTNDLAPFPSSSEKIDPGIGDRMPFDAPQELIFKVSILVLISVFGSVGNFIVIGSIIKTRLLHRPPFYFLLSMAATDLSRAGFCVPVVMATTLHGSRWGHGSAACKLFAFATSFFVFSSGLSLLAIAVDRHASIVHSKAYRRRCHGLGNLIVVVLVWVISFCISFPPVLGAGEYVFIRAEAQCVFEHRNHSHSDGVASVMLFVAIAFLTYFLYFRIYRFMRSHRRMRPLQHQPARSSNWTFVGPGANGQAFINWLNGFGGQTTANRQSGQRTVQRLNFGRVVNLSQSKNEHLTRLFLTLTVVFGLTWAPYIIVCLWRIFLDETGLPSGFVTSAAWTSYSQVALSPLTYFLARGKVRRSSRTIQSCPGDRKEFLLENKTRK